MIKLSSLIPEAKKKSNKWVWIAVRDGEVHYIANTKKKVAWYVATTHGEESAPAKGSKGRYDYIGPGGQAYQFDRVRESEIENEDRTIPSWVHDLR